jgi:hypothetical protein
MPRKFVIHGVGKEESATSQLGSESGLSGGAWVALSLLVGRCPGRRAHLSNPSYLPYSLPFSHSLQLISRLFQNLVRMSTIRRIKRTIPDSDDEDLEPLTLPPAEASTKRESKRKRTVLEDSEDEALGSSLTPESYPEDDSRLLPVPGGPIAQEASSADSSRRSRFSKALCMLLIFPSGRCEYGD